MSLWPTTGEVQAWGVFAVWLGNSALRLLLRVLAAFRAFGREWSANPSTGLQRPSVGASPRRPAGES